jgi:hypothetical protein
MVFLQNSEELVCSDLFCLQKLVWTPYHNSMDWAWGGSPWASGGGSARSHRRATDMALQLDGPHSKELRSKGEI